MARRRVWRENKGNLMCLAVPGRIISMKKGSAEVDFSGIKRAVSLDLVPAAKKGDYVLVHAGFAIQLLDPGEAVKTLELFKGRFSEGPGDAPQAPAAGKP